MTTNNQLKKAFAGVLPPPVKEGFVQVKASYLCFARQRGPFVDRLAIWVTRHGNFADATAMVWSPYLPMTSGFTGDNLDVEHMSPLVGGDLSERRVRESWMWDVRSEVFESTVRQLAEAVALVALPWFHSIDSGQALVRECALNPDYWRKVPRAERDAIAERVDGALQDETKVPRFHLLDEITAAQLVVPEKAAAKDVDENAYEQVTFPYQSKANPSLTGMITALAKKKN
jgi:hypothetical protein